jgi:hypothetical protein
MSETWLVDAVSFGTCGGLTVVVAVATVVFPHGIGSSRKVQPITHKGNVALRFLKLQFSYTDIFSAIL